MPDNLVLTNPTEGVFNRSEWFNGHIFHTVATYAAHVIVVSRVAIEPPSSTCYVQLLYHAALRQHLEVTVDGS
jgi:hypothetical protein